MERTYHYTYKVTFPAQRWWYWGLHSTDDLNDGYHGSPCTHKDKWSWYAWDLEILEFHDSRDAAAEVEFRLIYPDLNDPMCLNDNVGGLPSREANLRGLAKGRETQMSTPGFHAYVSSHQDPQKRDAAILKGQKKSVEVRRKETVLVLPNGSEETFESQKAACLAHGLSQGKLSEVAQGKKAHTKGFTVK